jgi:hypothetical protein
MTFFRRRQLRIALRFLMTAPVEHCLAGELSRRRRTILAIVIEGDQERQGSPWF